jgi:REP element-mobilizing transposase RayT
VHFPRPIRRPAEHYANRSLRFHLVFSAHPEISRWTQPLATLLWEAVLQQRAAERVHLFAACLMPNHLHLLVGPSEQDVIRFVNGWKSWTTRLAWSEGIRGGLWQPGMWDRTIRSEKDFDDVVQYIIKNPVAARLVEREEEWPWVWAWFWEK